jgi:glycosyltransferase involved in cell wall biosynthesis
MDAITKRMQVPDEPGMPRSAAPSIMFLVSPGTAPTGIGGGSQLIAHDLLEAFSKRGCSVSFCCMVKPARFTGGQAEVQSTLDAGVPDGLQIFFAQRNLDQRDTAFVSDAIARCKPDIIYCYGAEAAALAAHAGSPAMRLVTFYDPPHSMAWHRALCDLHYGTVRTKLRAVRKWSDLLGRWRSYRKHHLPGVDSADVVLGHAHHYGITHGKALERKVEYFPNPLLPVPAITRRPSKLPTFISVGNISSTVSRAGLQFLAYDALPYLRRALEEKELSIRIIGGGTSTEDYAETLKACPGIYFDGFLSADQLLEQYETCAALIVPTPIPIGFRTRIVDAFRYGVPVISHIANKAGFAELKNGQNCLLASNGKEFSDAMLSVARNQAIAERVAANALAEFHQSYSALVYVDKVLEFHRDWETGRAPA